jgi:hypothetical protein
MIPTWQEDFAQPLDRLVRTWEPAKLSKTPGDTWIVPRAAVLAILSEPKQAV